MKKRTRKRWAAFLIVGCLIAGIWGNHAVSMNVSQAVASEDISQTIPEKRYTFQDFGLNAGTYYVSEANAFDGDIDNLLDGGVFHEKITLHREGENNQFLIFFRDSDGGWHGLRFHTYAGGIEVGFSEELRAGASMAGDNYVHILPQYVTNRSTFLDSEIDLKIRFDIGGDAGEDLILRIYIDDVLYTAGGTDADCVNGVITVPNAAKTIQEKESANVDFIGVAGTSITIQNPKYEFTFEDFGVTDGNYGVSEANAFQGNVMNLLNGGVLHEKLSVHLGGSYNHFLIFFRDSDAGWHGLRFQTYAGGIEVGFSEELRAGEAMPGDNFVHILPQYVENRSSFSDSEFDLKVKFEIGGDAGEDLLLRIYIDDVLYTAGGTDADCVDGLITVPNAARTIAAKASGNLDMIGLGGTQITVKAPTEEVPELEQTEYSFADFGMAEEVYPNNTPYQEFTGEVSQLLNGGIIRQKMEVSRGSTGGFIVLFSDADNPWKGIQVNFLSNGAITVSIDGALRQEEVMAEDAAFDVLPALAERSTFLNSEFEIAFALSTSGENQEDLEMKIYIDGEHYTGFGDKDYKNGVAVIPNATAVIAEGRQNISMLFANDGVVTLLDANEEEIIDTNPTVTEELCNLAQADGTLGTYLVTGEGKITVNGSSQTNGALLSAPGDYVVRCIGEKSYEKNVCLYVPGQARPDEALDVRDLVAAKKVAAEKIVATGAAKEGADANRDGKVTESDCEQIRTYLVLPDEEAVAMQADDFIAYEKDTMPIAGYYGPYQATDTTRNVAYDLITDDVYAKLQTLGINLIVSSPNDYLTEPEVVRKQLSLAEKYGMDVYLSDSRTRNALANTDLSVYFKKYAQYSSFKGITVVDEPSTTDFGEANAGKQMEYYAGQASGINKYSNYLAYANLYPRQQNLALNGNVSADYRSYLTEYVDTYHPKMISYDHYLFDRYTEGNSIPDVQHWYLWNLRIVREVALEKGIPFWSYAQAGRNWSTDSNGTTTVNNTPTKGQLFWNVNTALAYGAKGIQYFPLVQPPEFTYGEKGTFDYKRNGLLGADGNETIWYGYAKEANNQIKTVDEVLMNATSKQVLWTGYDVYQAILTGGVSDGEILENITTEYKAYATSSGEVQRPCSTIVGVFDYQGKTAYYVVNYDMEETRTVTLEFYETQEYTVLSGQLATEHTANSGESCALNLVAGGAAVVIVD